MEWITIIGLTAGSLTTISFLPQAIKTWRSKSAKDISLAMFLCFCLGVVLWIIYGLFIMDIPVLVTNIVTLILSGTILFFKLKYK
ncbi:SemiSWEET transporter [Cyanobacterium sp. Dongsha4]|uniref:SemiSWEET transporter n=1 Tax=Cyanobacterium sp. DS4 TaxID=2878255 RepID=UPI002E8079D2|nr:SemiSWEET transporter [Cyanobacterium sp. Dongsha4]WVL00060.1 SemiSWEET transporter [Cyanobacterium sp. Dongsha4]